MATNEKNSQMREDILNIANDLFYEQGYKKTLFSHIAKELDITKGLITYYFGTKANLAQEVYTRFTRILHNELTFKMYSKYRDEFEYEPMLIMSVSNLFTLHMFQTDEKARRFYVEHMYENFQYSVEDTYIPFYMEQRRKSNRKELEQYDFVKMVAFSERAARASVILGYSEVISVFPLNSWLITVFR